MPIVDIQRRFRELGRIRPGKKEATGRKNRKGQPIMKPVKLPRYRLTSPWQHLIEQAAEVYGGTAEPWHNDGTNAEEWEVYVDAESIPVVVPPGEVFDQWYELWSGGGCERRCDGVAQVLTDRPCACPEDPMERQALAAEGKACKPTTRLRLMLPDVADVGIWRLESHGFHAAAELGGAAGLVEAATRAGAMIPADLRLALREGARRPGEQRKKFYVPVLSFRGTLGPVLDALGILEAGSEMPALLGHVEGRPAIAPGGAPALPAGGTPFDPASVEAASLPGRAPDPPAAGPPPADDPGPGAPADPPAAFEPPATEDPGRTAPEPETFDPPPHDPDAQADAEQGGRAYTAPQLIAMKLKDGGIEDRAEKLRAVRSLVGREVKSSKDLTTAEVRHVLDVLNDDARAEDFWAQHTEAELARAREDPPSGPESAQEPSAPPEAPAITGELVEGPPRRRRLVDTPATPDDPAGWDAARWRAVLAEHGVKAVAVLREAGRLARAREVAAPTNLDAIAGSGLAADLAGFVYAGGPGT